jgi:3-oxoacyl-[acyl-carrier protein] reductase
MSFDGKVSIVTGSATGLGAATALRLAKAGSRVLINYSKSAKEAQEALDLCKSTGAEAILVQGDVADDKDCRRMVASAVDAWGRVDILVNNAGTTKFTRQGDLDALDADDFLKIYRVNVVGPYQMVRACAPHMLAAGKGAVVNISSIAGVTGTGSSIAYAASKGALNTLTLSLARSLAPIIRVNAVCPGFIGTRWFLDGLDEERHRAMIEQQKEQTPLRRSGTAEDMVAAVVFFAGEGSDHVTGETLMVDAGMHLGPAPLVAR